MMCTKIPQQPMEEYRQILKKYIPTASVDIILHLLREHQLHLRITRVRRSKLGDFRPSANGGLHKISVNHDLNPYAFLITLLHEIAHAQVWQRYGSKAKPHGREWKHVYKELLLPIVREGIFPDDIKNALRKYLVNAKAASMSDMQLARALKKFDSRESILLEDIPEGAVFRIYNGKSFKKMERKRTRYRCLCLDNQRIYLINPLADVTPYRSSDKGMIEC